MIQSKREQLLLMLVLLSFLGAAGFYVYRTFGENFFDLQSSIEDKLAQTDQLLEKQKETGIITKQYEDMMKEIVLEGDDSTQILEVNQTITDILKQVGVEGKVTTKQPEKTEDFKILSISIENLVCTPEQLGNLLYLIEKESSVMEVASCQIDNLVRDNGRIGYQASSKFDENQILGGLLSISNLQISRVVEYRKGEKPKARGGRRTN